MLLGHFRDRSALLAGRGLRYRALGSESLFRVLSSSESTVEVEVVSAPGLAPGARLNLCLDSTRAGELVALSADLTSCPPASWGASPPSTPAGAR